MERVLTLSADAGLGLISQSLLPSVWCIRQGSAFPRPHGKAELRDLARHLRVFRDALVPRIRLETLLLGMLQLSC